MRNSLIMLASIIYASTACKISNRIVQNTDQFEEYILDLRDVIKTGGKRTDDAKLFILNIRSKQAVFEIKESNANILSNIKASSIKHLSITRNKNDKFDTKYNTIIIMSLQRNTYKLLNNNLKRILK